MPREPCRVKYFAFYLILIGSKEALIALEQRRKYVTDSIEFAAKCVGGVRNTFSLLEKAIDELHA